MANVLRTAKSVQLQSNGFTFIKDYRRKEMMYWKCLMASCKARLRSALISDGDTYAMVTDTNIHNHAASIKVKEDWEVKLLQLLKTHEMVKPCVIINKLYANCSTVPS